jgi:hypothetical protein
MEESIEEEWKRGCHKMPERIVSIADRSIARSSYRKSGIYELGYFDFSAFSFECFELCLGLFP